MYRNVQKNESDAYMKSPDGQMLRQLLTSFATGIVFSNPGDTSIFVSFGGDNRADEVKRLVHKRLEHTLKKKNKPSKKSKEATIQRIMTPEESTTDSSSTRHPIPVAQHCLSSTRTRITPNGDRVKNYDGAAEQMKKQSSKRRFQSVLQDNVRQSNSDTANAFSNSLVDTALNAVAGHRHHGHGSSYSGLEASFPSRSHERKVTISTSTSRRRNSGEDSGASTGLLAVTESTGTSTPTGSASNTSWGDDQTTSRASASRERTVENGVDRVSPEGNLLAPFLSSGEGFHHQYPKRHHHYHHHHEKPGDDGSSLRLPDDDGSDHLSTGPATVVASNAPPLKYGTGGARELGQGGGTEAHEVFLLHPHREPGYHTIRKTFNRLPRRIRDGDHSDDSSSSQEKSTAVIVKGKHRDTKAPRNHLRPTMSKNKKRRRLDVISGDIEGNGGGSSSGSGTEGGYLGSDDSKENDESTEVEDKEMDSSSSVIADFSSGATFENGEDNDDRDQFAMEPYQPSSPFMSSSNEDDNTSSDGDYEDAYRKAKSHVIEEQQRLLSATIRRRFVVVDDSHPASIPTSSGVPSRLTGAKSSPDGEMGHHPSIMNIGSDIMAHVLTYLTPPKILEVLTMPLCKEWKQTYTSQAELWRVLCLVEPFKADTLVDDEGNPDTKANMDDDTQSSNSFCSLNGGMGNTGDAAVDRYRLLYTSFVRCMKYLSQIRDDALNGRAPSYIDYGITEKKGYTDNQTSMNQNLHSSLATARIGMDTGELSSSESLSSEEPQQAVAGPASRPTDKHENKKRKRGRNKTEKQNQLKLGQSMITKRLLGPSPSGMPGSLTLPWSCAVYSIVNWMVSFRDVEGIQTLCLKVLPFLLENELQRQTAQRAGLTDIVLRAMLAFPDSVHLHIAAFHTIVLLARPLGGREGMLFHSSMVLTGIFAGQSNTHPKSGIAIMIESMKRFEEDDALQAMSCWALVNVALAPSQKAELVKLGGIRATTNAMKLHPSSAEVQFRALFALINLVIPSVRLNREETGAAELPQHIVVVPDQSEKEITDEFVGEISTTVVQAMKNFCSSEAILNRGCLVLHNLSLSTTYHSKLLLTPNCYQMLEWSLANYRADRVLQQSALGTLQRLQLTLSNNETLRSKFTQVLQSQQQEMLYLAHQEAIRLLHRQEQLHRPS